MARRKHTRKKTTHRRSIGAAHRSVRTTHRRRRSRRAAMHGVPDFAISIAAGTVGYLVATAGSKLIPVQNPMIKAAIKGGVAFIIPKVMKSKVGEAVALGIGISAVSDLGKQFLPQFFAGIGDEPVVLIQGADDGGGNLLNAAEGGAATLLSGAEDALGGDPDKLGTSEDHLGDGSGGASTTL